MKKILVILTFTALVATCSFAQEKEAFGLRTGIGFVPQYTISGGLRFDIDRSISKTSNQWLIISPQVFALTGMRYDHDFEELTGVGMDIKHKIYLNPNSMKPLGFYAQYGVMFQYFSITENRQYTELIYENGIEYYEVVEGELNTKLYKMGGNFHLGYQWLVGDKVYFDIYTGAGIRISHNNQNEGFDTWYNNYWIDYGYSGTLLDAGFRVGFYF
jgi:hypothetical protein